MGQGCVKGRSCELRMLSQGGRRDAMALGPWPQTLRLEHVQFPKLILQTVGLRELLLLCACCVREAC